jgi:hypothetical protein
VEEIEVSYRHVLMRTTRGIVLAATALFAVIVGGFLYVALSGGDSRQVGALRTYNTTKTLLSINGQPMGYLKSSSCGTVGAQPVRQPAELAGKNGPDPKQIGAPVYEPCQFVFGLGMEPAVYSWINSAMAGGKGAGPRDLTLQYLDGNNLEKRVADLSQATITEFSLPALDASSKETAFMTLTVSSQAVRYKNGSGATVSYSPTAAQKGWLEANFKLEVGGAEGKMVTKVSSIGFEVAEGTSRPLFREFTVTVSEADLSPFSKLLETFVIGGQNGPEYEKSAKLTFLGPDFVTAMGALTMTGVGLSGGDLVSSSYSPTDTVQRRSYTLYFEGASLSL